MHQALDTVFSIVIGGMILIALFTMNGRMNNAAITKTMSTVVQQNAAAFADIIQYDMRKIGYNTLSFFVLAETSRVRMVGDIDDNNVADTIYYYIGSTSDPAKVNPRSRVLYRQVNNGAVQAMTLGATRLRFTYYNQNGIPLAANPAVSNPSLIRSLKVHLYLDVAAYVEPYKDGGGTYRYDTTYTALAWERMIKPVNVK